MEKENWADKFDRLAKEAGWEFIGFGPPEDNPWVIGQDGGYLCSGIANYKKNDQYADVYWIMDHIVRPALEREKQESNN